jgi:hypothetical protein
MQRVNHPNGRLLRADGPREMIRIAPHRYRLHVLPEFASALLKSEQTLRRWNSRGWLDIQQQRRRRLRTGRLYAANIVDVLCRTGDHQHRLRYEGC